MTRPPVGSTGTLAELQVEAGDVVEFDHPTQGKMAHTIDRMEGLVYISRSSDEALGNSCPWTLISRANPDQPALQIEAGKYYRTRDGRKVGPMVEETPRWSEWPWDIKNGQGDLRRILWKDDGTADETQGADLIAEWQDDQPAHIITHEGRTYDLTALETPFGLLLENARPVAEALQAWPYGVCVYGGNGWWDVSPEWDKRQAYRAVPAPTETRIVCYRGEYCKAKECGTCIKRPDGSIDWASWEDAE